VETIVKTQAAVPVCSAREPMAMDKRGAKGVSQPRVSPAPHGWGGGGVEFHISEGYKSGEEGVAQ
jgi:hypothetical protein